MPSPIGILESLSPHQQELLLNWMETLPHKVVLSKVNAPPPDGFGVATHLTSLRRFYARKQNEVAIQDLEIARKSLITSHSATEFREASLAALMHQAFQITSEAAVNPSSFRAVAHWLSNVQEQELALEKLKLARERLALQRQKLELDAFYKAASSPSAAQEEKITQAVERIIKPSPNIESHLE
jgi:hypothetical protein